MRFSFFRFFRVYVCVYVMAALRFCIKISRPN